MEGKKGTYVRIEASSAWTFLANSVPLPRDTRVNASGTSLSSILSNHEFGCLCGKDVTSSERSS
jgi:hypothetical protein